MNPDYYVSPPAVLATLAGHAEVHEQVRELDRATVAASDASAAVHEADRVSALAHAGKGIPPSEALDRLAAARKARDEANTRARSAERALLDHIHENAAEWEPRLKERADVAYRNVLDLAETFHGQVSAYVKAVSLWRWVAYSPDHNLWHLTTPKAVAVVDLTQLPDPTDVVRAEVRDAQVREAEEAERFRRTGL
jgi:hypothetical protein